MNGTRLDTRQSVFRVHRLCSAARWRRRRVPWSDAVRPIRTVESDRAEQPETARRRLAENEPLATAEHAMAEGAAAPEQERALLADAARRSCRRRTEAWRRAVRHGWHDSSEHEV